MAVVAAALVVAVVAEYCTILFLGASIVSLSLALLRGNGSSKQLLAVVSCFFVTSAAMFAANWAGIQSKRTTGYELAGIVVIMMFTTYRLVIGWVGNGNFGSTSFLDHSRKWQRLRQKLEAKRRARRDS